jgi:hypothetical protein
VRAIGIDAEAWRMIRQGEATLRRILHPEYDRDDDDDELMRRVLVSSMARPSCSIQYQP